VRNESILIKKKIDELLSMNLDYTNVSILVVDSCSTDETRSIAEQHLNCHEKKLDWRVMQVSTPGKSFAVNFALEIIKSDFFVMVDTDAILTRDAISNILRWFSESDVGAVCGKMSIDEIANGVEYRRRFNKIRLGESALNSTPIFEGSICAFRTSAIGKSRINSNINADDSQLSMIVRRNGFRAIMDPEVTFTESNIDGNFSSRMRRSTRRAQGISRTLWANRDLLFFPEKIYRRIFLSQFYFYLIFPWAVFSSFMMICYSVIWWSNVTLGNPSFGIGLIVIGAPISSSNRFSKEFSIGLLSLIMSHILLLAGKRLNSWVPDRNHRKRVLQHRLDSNN
jgi:cellulose synthase/poly-beta-1,6-N-acetylglucosamine synthase-like glycosyltransferase